MAAGGAIDLTATWGVCVSRTISVVCIVCITILLSLYYMATEDARYLALPSSNSAKFYADAAARGFLVDGPKCRIPDVDPYDKDVRQFIHTVPHISCSKQQLLTYVEKFDGYSTLHVDKHMVSSYSKQGVQCCYSNITRGHNDKKPDDAISISKCQDFKNSVNISENYIIVKCVTKNRKKEVYKNAHSSINVTPKIKERVQENYINSNNDTKMLSVLMVGIDSISRLNSLRTMPRTLEYLNDNGWVELKGYNKIADNTYPNLMAVLTGIDGDSTYEVCLPTKLYRLDNCSFIWTKYRDNGYVTAYAEDAASISTFNYHKVGFVHQPVDYYFRPYMLAIEKQLKGIDKYSMRYCVGPISAAERIISFAKDFATTFVNDANFGLFWMNTFSHNDLNMPSGMDNAMLHFFEELTDRGVNENNMIVFFSDHGIRFGDIRHTKIGRLEERLPFIYIYLPEWFRQRYPSEYRNLQINAHRLTTPYDLHMTLQDVLVLSGKTNSIKQSSGCPKCKSLFSEIDINRSCEDAAISPHWCMCTSFKEVSNDNSTVQNAAKYIVKRIQKYIDDAGPALSRKCAQVKLNKIKISQVGESYANDTYYLLFIETMPGRGKFEATVSLERSSKTNEDVFKLHSSISRLDSYADQSNCVQDANLKKYCYCR
ncbi:uncharacterized protein CBL_00725 [Carabus blaptoides fortunei]